MYKELDKAKTDFMSIASHQLKTPLAGLRWSMESLRIPAEKLDDKQQAYLKNIQQYVDTLNKVVEDLLNVSRVELGTLQVDPKTVDFPGFMKNFFEVLKPYAESQKHTLMLTGEDQAPKTIVTDPKLLYNVLQNLVSNALEYSPPDTDVAISIATDSNFLRVSVSNQGQAISDEAKGHIFEKFYRAPEARRMKPSGSGVGLFVVKSFVELLGGTVGFVSEEGKNTTFWLKLPIAKT